MWEAVGKYVGGKVLTAILVVLTAGCGIWAWRHPDQLAAIGQVLKYVGVWIGIVVVIPWAAYPLTVMAVRRDSNVAGAILLALVTLLDVVAALMMTGTSGHGALVWLVLLLGFLTAGVYNFVVCNYQANRLEDSL